MKKRPLIIGFGNPLRGDDRLGWEVASRVKECGGANLDVLMVHQLTPELAVPIALADKVIFVDASYDGVPGEWRCNLAYPEPGVGSTLGHCSEIPELLASARTLFHLCPSAIVISVTGESFDCSDRLTPCVEAAIPKVVAFIREQIDLQVIA